MDRSSFVSWNTANENQLLKKSPDESFGLAGAPESNIQCGDIHLRTLRTVSSTQKAFSTHRICLPLEQVIFARTDMPPVGLKNPSCDFHETSQRKTPTSTSGEFWSQPLSIPQKKVHRDNLSVEDAKMDRLVSTESEESSCCKEASIQGKQVGFSASQAFGI